MNTTSRFHVQRRLCYHAHSSISLMIFYSPDLIDCYHLQARQWHGTCSNSDDLLHNGYGFQNLEKYRTALKNMQSPSEFTCDSCKEPLQYSNILERAYAAALLDSNRDRAPIVELKQIYCATWPIGGREACLPSLIVLLVSISVWKSRITDKSIFLGINGVLFVGTEQKYSRVISLTLNVPTVMYFYIYEPILGLGSPVRTSGIPRGSYSLVVRVFLLEKQMIPWRKIQLDARSETSRWDRKMFWGPVEVVNSE